MANKRTRNRKKFNYNVNLRKKWRKMKKQPTVLCEQMKHNWDPKKTTKQNMHDMGLSYDPNEAVPIPKTKEVMKPKNLKDEEEMDVDNIRSRQTKKKKLDPTKLHVVQELEDLSKLPTNPSRTFRLSAPVVQYCVYMLDKYGDDYKAMARDKKNYYQDTPKQIRQKINIFKGIPAHYNEYLKSKESGKVENMETEALTT
ncbi:nucleolar protein 16-like [Anneissia japonica]|uniref:nucleolar protein 16-like n=1 Tax=Anneissia japonica TaxID=1529436 RepID=UPI00142595E7|nr:nucleolar protein 16-like [Anneissia japonica]